MGVHEWILIGLVVVAGAVVVVESQRSKRRGPEPDVEITASPGPPPVLHRHILLVGHNAVTRVSIRRALEKYMTVTEARDASEGLEQLGAIGPDVAPTVVVDLTTGEGATEEFVGAALAAAGDRPVRVLAVAPAGGPAAPGGPVEYLAPPQSIPSLLDAIQREPERA